MHQLITKIGKGQRGAKDLSWGEAKQAAQDLIEGNATPYQAGAFLMAMRIKLEGVTELASFTAVTRSYVPPISVPTDLNVVDVPVYAEKHNTQHVCLPAAIVAAAAGATILFHGMDNPTASSDLPRILGATGRPHHVARARPACKPATERIRVPGHRVVSPPPGKVTGVARTTGSPKPVPSGRPAAQSHASALASDGRSPSAVSRKDAGSGEHARWTPAHGFSGDGRISRTVDSDPDDHAGTA